jgi:hypothetical protein
LSSSTRRRPFRSNRGSTSPTTGPVGRGQTTPIVALVALFAVCAGISLYATTLGTVIPDRPDNTLAEPTLERVYDVTVDGGSVSPGRLSYVDRAAPDGYRIAVTITIDAGRWMAGSRPPPKPKRVDTATRSVAVAMADGSVAWGRLRVRVWR